MCLVVVLLLLLMLVVVVVVVGVVVVVVAVVGCRWLFAVRVLVLGWVGGTGLLGVRVVVAAVVVMRREDVGRGIMDKDKARGRGRHQGKVSGGRSKDVILLIIIISIFMSRRGGRSLAVPTRRWLLYVLVFIALGSSILAVWIWLFVSEGQRRCAGVRRAGRRVLVDAFGTLIQLIGVCRFIRSQFWTKWMTDNVCVGVPACDQSAMCEPWPQLRVAAEHEE